MFVRKKKNSSGSVSVQIISKNNNKYKVVETIGCGRNEFEVEQLLQNAKNRLIELEPNLFDFMNYNNQKLTNKDMRVIGDELIFGKLFKDLGCENILLKKEEDKEKENIDNIIEIRMPNHLSFRNNKDNLMIIIADTNLNIVLLNDFILFSISLIRT